MTVCRAADAAVCAQRCMRYLQVFPAMTSGSTALSNKVKAVVAQETREDLKLMAARYQASLARQHDIPGRMHSMDQYGGKPTSLRKPKRKWWLGEGDDALPICLPALCCITNARLEVCYSWTACLVC